MVLLESKVIKLHCNLVLDLDNSIVLFYFYVPCLILDWRDLKNKTGDYGDGGRIGDQVTVSVI